MEVTIEQMAAAHLQTVQQAIVDLQNKKQQIDEELKKLHEYVNSGTEVLKSSSN